MARWWEEAKAVPEEEGEEIEIRADPAYLIVTFNTNGGSPVPIYQRIVKGSTVASVPPISRDGFGFGGWYSDPQFSTTWDFENDVVEDDGIIISALWGDLFYTVHFETYATIRNGSGDLKALTLGEQRIIPDGRITEPIEVRSPSVQQDDLVSQWSGFAGWYKEAEYINSWDFEVDVVQSDMLLHAKWVQQFQTVKFQANGGTPEPEAQQLIAGERVIEPFAMRRDGFGFGGWFEDETFTIPWSFSHNRIGNRDITLYAQWIPFIYTITFDSLGGSTPPEPLTVAYGVILSPVPPVHRGGFGFSGWFIDPNGAIPWNFEDDRVSASMILYAGWTEGLYTITFIPNNGEDPTIARNIRQGATIPEPSIGGVPNRTLDGWYRTEENASLVDWWDFAADVASADTTLYARWVDTNIDGNEDLIWIPTGAFIMGDNGVSGSRPAHRVRLSGFYMNIYEVSQEEFLAIMQVNPSNAGAGTDHELRPVERVSWFDAIEYCIRLSTLENLTPVYTLTNIVRTPISGTGNPGILSITNATVTVNWNANGYRLPTEAEWEYASRGGNGSPGNFIYSGSNEPDLVAWFNQTANGVPHPVGNLKANGLGLFDMSGNASEWCWDWFAADYYSLMPALPGFIDNPKGPDTGTERTRRGGAWSNAYSNVRSVVRNSFTPNNNTWVMGFRVLRSY